MFKFILGFLFVFSVSVSASPSKSINLITDAIATQTGDPIVPWNEKRTFQASGITSAGAGSVTVIIEASNFDSSVVTDWIPLGTISLVLSTTSISDGFISDASWRFVRARITAIAGTDATVNVYMANDPR